MPVFNRFYTAISLGNLYLNISYQLHRLRLLYLFIGYFGIHMLHSFR